MGLLSEPSRLRELPSSRTLSYFARPCQKQFPGGESLIVAVVDDPESAQGGAVPSYRGREE